MSSVNLDRRNHLYTLRRIRGLGQKQLAYLLGYRGTSMVSRFEHGVSLPPIKVALLMEIVLGARLADIYHDEYSRLQRLVLRRCQHLPHAVTRHIRGRILGRD
jgi:DNA-binding XRE family transcriptional regulator